MRIVKTRSAIDPSRYSALEDFFKTTEEDAGTFLDVIKDIIQEDGSDVRETAMRQLVSGKPDKIKTPKLMAEHLSGFVRIICGWHGGDYVWHIEHAAIKRPWAVSTDKVIYTIAKIMHDNLPDVEAKIWPPQPDWELRAITFKAINLASIWSFDEGVIPKINQKLFEVLNTYV